MLKKVFEKNIFIVRFRVLTSASMTVRVFWDVALCSLVEVDRRFRAMNHPNNGGSTYL
jgi:hypothetical protein